MQRGWRKIFLVWGIWLALALNLQVFAQQDSLLQVFRNPQYPDSVRLKALINYLSNTMNYDSTFTTLLDTANSMLKVTKIDSHYVGRFYNTLGTYLYFTDQYDSARKVLKKAINIFKRLNDLYYTAISYGNYGNTFCFKGELKECLKYLLKAQEYFYQVKDTNLIITGELNIGALYLSLKDTVKAYKRYKKAYHLARKTNNQVKIALAARNLGYIFLSRNQLDSAKFYAFKAIKYANKLKDKRILGTSYNILASVYLDNKQYDSAFYIINQTIKIFKDLHDQSMLSYAYNNLAEYYLQKRLYAKAKKYAITALNISKSIGTREQIRDAYLKLYLIDSSTGNYKSALAHYLMYKKYEDSIAHADVKEKIAQIEADYQLRLKERENNLLKEKERHQREVIRRQKVTLALSFIIILLLIAFIVYHLKTDRKIKQKNLLLIQQKQEIEKQRDLLLKQKQDLDASLKYAASLQKSMLPDLSVLNQFFKEWFLFYKPKAVVSGDFYWVKKINQDKIIIVVGDCTGHGVPGAILSVFSITLLNDSIREISEITAAEALNVGRQKIKKILVAKNAGLDVAMVIFDRQQKLINFAGAFRPIYVIHQGQLIALKGNKQPIAANYIKEEPFEDHYLQVTDGDMLYMFTDGFPDMLSADQRKYTTGRFKQLLLKIYNLPAQEQLKELEKVYLAWKKDAPQIDDITILGMRI